MSGTAKSDALLVERIRGGDESAWSDLISRYEGRLLAFAESRLARRNAGEDIVQETFVGFLNSLPNYDGRRPLESYLFAICAYKLTDHLRREGRRPTLPLAAYTAFGERLAGAELLGQGGRGKQIRSIRLASGRKQFELLWSLQGTREVALKKGEEVLDLYGFPMAKANRARRLTLTSTPIYITRTRAHSR